MGRIMSIEMKKPTEPKKPTKTKFVSTKSFSCKNISLDALNKRVQKIKEDLADCSDIKVLIKGKENFSSYNYKRDTTVEVTIEYVDEKQKERYQEYSDAVANYYDQMVVYERQLAEYKIQSLKKKIETL